MKRRFQVTLLLLFTLGFAGEGISQEGLHRFNVLSTKSLAAFAQRKENLPGLAIAAAVEGETGILEGYGFADVESKTAIDPVKSQFRIGSISKPLTAAGLAKLHEAGKIDLDASIDTYLPDFPEKQWPVTTRQLAGHLAGIRHYQDREVFRNEVFPDVTSSLRIFQSDPLLY